MHCKHETRGRATVYIVASTITICSRRCSWVMMEKSTFLNVDTSYTRGLQTIRDVFFLSHRLPLVLLG